ncbi:branched-chain amino acid transporter AzlC [Moraxella caviae]|uniref:Branched-chain amino acid transporter AzlC n=1 Tax=Moraxella caviae TaxID=34060 RepID=A0A1T0A0X1_9GAMM|nr:AzlC family ABC transporter permease [Moraxella caviae]OOR89402.1 branched-chain amino acid transporter AzlC [Moraxella caviae]STZ09876.1 Inner membrane protein YgaZ [Moraxella caviae]VEW12926.1 Inner membrane protein YgaZ [Moraxella caviae]
MISPDLRHTAKAAFAHSLPIMSGFLFLGMAYGVYMSSLGFSAWYPALMALFIFAGSVEFIVAGMLIMAFAPSSVLLLVLMVSARQIFYGISMLGKFEGITGWKRWYLIAGMTDESFAINYTADPNGVDRAWFMVLVTLFLHIYWVAGSALGGVLGAVLPFDLTGAEFAMTALFLVIFVEQWARERTHESSLVGIGMTAACLIIFGKTHFLLPAMGGILLYLSVRKKAIEAKMANAKPAKS